MATKEDLEKSLREMQQMLLNEQQTTDRIRSERNELRCKINEAEQKLAANGANGNGGVNLPVVKAISVCSTIGSLPEFKCGDD